MPKAIAFHEVDDVAHWLGSTKRDEVFKGVMDDITTFVHPTNPNMVGLSGTIKDLDAFQALMASEASATAMKHDGVRAETIVLMLES